MPRRRPQADRPPQFQTPTEATAWAIMAASLASTAEDLSEAASEADDLLAMWRDRNEELDAEREEPEDDE